MDVHTDPVVVSGAVPPQGADSGERNAVDVREHKDMAALSYAWVLSVFVYLAKRDSPFVRFHAQQAMVLFALSVVFWFVPVIGRVLELIILAFCSFGFLAAAQGEWKELPFVGAVAKGDWTVVRTQWKAFVSAMVRGMKALLGLVRTRRHAAADADSAERKPSSPATGGDHSSNSAAEGGRFLGSSDSLPPPPSIH